MINIQCAICNHNKSCRVLFKESFRFRSIDTQIFSARRIPDRIHYRLLQCLQCGLIFSSPILPVEKLNLLYRKSRFTYNSEINSLKETYGRYLDRAKRFSNPSPSLLEIGCGNGFFLERALSSGVSDLQGIEPSVDAVKKSRPEIRNKIITGFFPSKKLKNKRFDIICIFQTLDHVTDPNRVISECFRLLNKGGVVLCILHNTDGLSVRLLGEKSPIFDIEHIYLFNPSSLSTLFQNHGFLIEDVFSVSNTFPLRYWTRMFPLPAFFKTILRDSLMKTPLGSVPITLSAGNIGIIAKKPF